MRLPVAVAIKREPLLCNPSSLDNGYQQPLGPYQHGLAGALMPLTRWQEQHQQNLLAFIGIGNVILANQQ